MALGMLVKVALWLRSAGTKPWSLCRALNKMGEENEAVKGRGFVFWGGLLAGLGLGS